MRKCQIIGYRTPIIFELPMVMRDLVTVLSSLGGVYLSKVGIPIQTCTLCRSRRHRQQGVGVRCGARPAAASSVGESR